MIVVSDLSIVVIFDRNDTIAEATQSSHMRNFTAIDCLYFLSTIEKNFAMVTFTVLLDESVFGFGFFVFEYVLFHLSLEWGDSFC